MSTAFGTGQHSDTVVCVRDEVSDCDVKVGGGPTVRGDPGLWEADLIAVDFSVGIKRTGPRDLKNNNMDSSGGLFIENTAMTEILGLVHTVPPNWSPEKSFHWLAGHS